MAFEDLMNIFLYMPLKRRLYHIQGMLFCRAPFALGLRCGLSFVTFQSEAEEAYGYSFCVQSCQA